MTRITPTLKNSVINDKQPITFTYRGKKYSGFEGDSLASALYANGEKVFAKSFKYARARGMMAPYADEPNMLLSLEKGGYYTPNAKATQVELYQDLEAQAPTLQFGFASSVKPLFKAFHKFMKAGFYYKTFMWPANLWLFYEKYIRQMSGTSKAPIENDLEQYDHMNHHCDFLVVGGGISGISFVLDLAKENSDKKIILVDERNCLGGTIYDYPEELVDGQTTQIDWLKDAVKEITKLKNIKVLNRTSAFAFHDENLVLANESRQDHIPLNKRNSKSSRQRLHKFYAKKVILATGAGERPIAFLNNDLPNVMLCSAGLSLLNRYSVLAGKKIVVFANNDSGVDTAIYFSKYAESVDLVDVRERLSESVVSKLDNTNIRVHMNSCVFKALGKSKVTGVEVCQLNSEGKSDLQNKQNISCDLVLVSGGFNPIVHLDCHTGSKPFWSDDVVAFVPKLDKKDRLGIGSLAGYFLGKDILENTKNALSSLESDSSLINSDNSLNTSNFFRVKDSNNSSHNKQFVDLQNDVTVADIELAVRENYKCIEHVKRYTALGFGTDQGKTSNVLGVSIAAESQNLSMSEVGTTTFRPAYTPVTFGALAGAYQGQLFDPCRYTAMNQSHLINKADWELVGQWFRPISFPKNNENYREAAHIESSKTRESVGMMDVSTLGKIDIQGEDAREFLSRVYTNAWAKLKKGMGRYGIMVDENGMIMDDGVTTCLDDNHFLMTTTSGGAARIYQWLELWLQTEWPDLKVHLTSVSDHYATTAVVGPKSREIMQMICNDVDFSKEAFPFLACKEGTILGVKARINRISFSGELSFEINVQANYGRYIWDKITDIGKKFGIVQYGTETMRLLRAEKGYVIDGQDTDGTVTPIDADLSWIVAKNKDFSFLGERSLYREDTSRTNRKQLVGLLTEDPEKVLIEGAQILKKPNDNKSIGFVTSSYYSPILGKSIAMALIENGLHDKGETVYVYTKKGPTIKAKIESYIFYDKDNKKANL